MGRVTSPSNAPEPWPGDHRTLGATTDADGTNFAVWAPDAQRVWLCLFDEDGHETRVELREHTLGVWHGYVRGVRHGQLYGYRVDGAWEPSRGQLFNSDKLLLDPYARAIDGDLVPDPSLAAVDDGGARVPGDTAPYTPRSVVVDSGDFDWEGDTRLDLLWSRTVVYETHVRGLTMLHPGVPDHLRGTYAGLAHPAVVDHLVDLGVTSVELLPVHHFCSEPALTGRGLTNYWGYNSIGYFAPHAAYSSSGRRGEQINEFKQMVKDLHASGIEVVLDVVYNHTAEGPVTGPALAFRGYDDGSYYRSDSWGRYADVTGCGNTLQVSEPQVLRLVMDSLRYWVTEMHVDGFRFDLASALTRNGSSVDLNGPFLAAIHQDPVLRRVKLIAEPWDATGEGYLVGRFGPPWCEWNDKYRDAVRDFWRGRADGVRDLASRLSGSSDLYADDGRLPFSSVNFVTAHDGFTLRDLVSYDHKHNAANGDQNRDGTSDNRSWNCGFEGETDDLDVVSLRRRQSANLLATLLLSTGVPMITAGDELGRTQRGNNNAYCHDSDLSWVSWEVDDDWAHLAPLARRLLELRDRHPVLRHRYFFEGTSLDGPGGRKDIAWLRPDGAEMDESDWLNHGQSTLGAFLAGDQLRSTDAQGRRRVDTSFLLWLHAGDAPVDVALPAGWAGQYVEVLRTDRLDELGSTDPSVRQREAGTTMRLEPRTLALLEALL